MHVKVSKIKSKHYRSLPEKEGYYFPLPEIAENHSYALIEIKHLHNHSTIDSAKTIIVYRKDFTHREIVKQIENHAFWSASIEKLLLRPTTLAVEGFKFHTVDTSTYIPQSRCRNYVYLENNCIATHVSLEEKVVRHRNCNISPTISLSGIPLPAHLVECESATLKCASGTCWLQVKEPQYGRSVGYHLSGPIENLPRKLLLLDIPNVPVDERYYSFNRGTLEYVGDIRPLTLTSDKFSGKGKKVSLNCNGVRINVKGFDPSQHYLNSDVVIHTQCVLSHHRKFGSLWDGGEIANVLEYLVDRGLIVKSEALEKHSEAV